MKSILIKSQKRILGPIPFPSYGRGYRITAEIRYDDQCGNGHNSFAVTGDICRPCGKIEACGCLHDEIAQAFPDLAPLLKWHLCSSDGPMHYMENAMYWAGFRGFCDGKLGDPPNMEHLKSTIVFGAAPGDPSEEIFEDFAKDEKCLAGFLEARKDGLIGAFHDAIVGFGFKF